MLQLFDKPVLRTKAVDVRGAKSTLHEITSDQWHEHIAIYDEDEIKRKDKLKGKELATELLDYNQRLVACSFLNNHPGKSFDDVLASVKALSDEILTELLVDVQELNGLRNEGNSQAASSGSD